MAFTISKEAFEEGVEKIKIIPYYDYGICIRIHEDKTYELWNFHNIPTSCVTKAVEDFLKDNPTINELKVYGKTFDIPKENIRKTLFEFLIALEESKLEET